MSSKNQEIFPRAGPASCRESRTSVQTEVCPIGYGGGNQTSTPESKNEETQIRTKDDEEIIPDYKVRRISSTRSPPSSRKGSLCLDGNATNNQIFDNLPAAQTVTVSSDDESTTDKKRSREITPPQQNKRGRQEVPYHRTISSNSKESQQESKSMTALNKLNEKIQLLVKFGEKNQNVHKQIKEISRTLLGLSEKVSTEFKMETQQSHQYIQELSENKAHLEQQLKEFENKMEILSSNKNKIDGNTNMCPRCQTEFIPTLKELDNLEYKSFEEAKATLEKRWSPEAYKNTLLEERDNIGRRPDHLILFANECNKPGTVEENSKAVVYGRLEKELTDRFPELLEETTLELDGGHYVTLEEITRIRSVPDKNCKEKIRTLTVMFRQEQCTTPDVTAFKLLRSLADILQDADANTATIIAPRYMDARYFRKLAECAFNTKTIKANIICDKGLSSAKGRPERPRNGAIIIQGGENRTYAEMLRMLKENIDPDTALQFKQARKTARGNLLLQVKDNEKLESLKSRVAEGLGNDSTNQIRTTGKEMKHTFFIRDLDEITTSEDVKDMLLNEGITEILDEQQVSIILNKNARDGQTAVLTMDANTAEKLKKISRIRIGFSTCRVQERISIERCFNCWEYGHNSRGCTNQPVDTKNKCFKCGQEGHQKAQCTSEDLFCHTCQTAGDQAGTIKCKNFRDALSNERMRRKNSIS